MKHHRQKVDTDQLEEQKKRKKTKNQLKTQNKCKNIEQMEIKMDSTPKIQNTKIK